VKCETTICYSCEKHGWNLTERHHQGLGNRLILEEASEPDNKGAIECRERLGGMLKVLLPCGMT
jgi:hypothetical protein